MRRSRCDNTKIVTLAPQEWQIYKNIALEAAVQEPSSFTAIYEYLEQLPKKHWMNNISEHSIQDGMKLFFAKRDLKIIGMIVAKVNDDHHAPDKAIVRALYVNKNYRKQNIASKLLMRMISKIKNQKNVKIVSLSVGKCNLPAISFYRKHEFQIAGSDIQIMSDGVEYEVLIMERRL